MAFEDMRSHLLESGGVVKINHYPVVGELFNSVRVYTSLYTSGNSLNIEYTDGKHTYRQDSLEATMIVRAGQELPQDLLDRLAYYKPIIDKQLQERR